MALRTNPPNLLPRKRPHAPGTRADRSTRRQMRRSRGHTGVVAQDHGPERERDAPRPNP